MFVATVIVKFCFFGYPAQTDRTDEVDLDNQSEETTNLRDPLVRAQFLNLLSPGRVENVDRHRVPAAKFFCGKNYYYNRSSFADQLFFC